MTANGWPPQVSWGVVLEGTGLLGAGWEHKRISDSREPTRLGFKDSWRRRYRGEVQQMSKHQRSATPDAFRNLLLSMARSVQRVEVPA